MFKAGKNEKIFYVIIGMILAVSISLIMTVRAQSVGREKVLFDNSYYAASEEAYKQQVQRILESYDCYNSGLTMTRVVSLDGAREYSILVYNNKLQKLDLNTYEELCKEIDACTVLLPDGTQYSVQVSYVRN